MVANRAYLPARQARTGLSLAGFAVNFLILSSLFLILSSAALRGGDDLFDDEDEDAGIEELLGEDAAWWNPKWQLRRRVTIEGPGLAMLPQNVLFLPFPDPLLLYNTGRCRSGLADLRVLTIDSQSLPSGVVNFGRDDGTSFIWCILPQDHSKVRVRLYLYYANPKAKPAKAVRPRGTEPGKAHLKSLFFISGPEESSRPGKLPAAVLSRLKPGFFSEVVAIEAESLAQHGRQKSGGAVASPVTGASAGRCLVVKGQQARKIELTRSLSIPAKGRWYVHVRFLPRRSTPFMLKLAGESRICGKGQKVEGFTWASYAVELAQGKAELSLQLKGPAVIDCLLLTRDKAYLPDYRDITGPVWMRFKIVAPMKVKYHAAMNCCHTPYSAEGQLFSMACWLFRTRAAYQKSVYTSMLKDDRNLVQSGEWTAWGRALHSRNYTWYTRVSFLFHNRNRNRNRPENDLRVAFQFASRPDVSRVFNEGVEHIGSTNNVQVIMPTELGLEGWAGLRRTRSFGQWARDRFGFAKQLGFKAGEGPRHIVAGPMADAVPTREEFEYLVKALSWLGCNALEAHFNDKKVYAQIMDRHGMTGFFFHPWAYGLGHSYEKPPPGRGYIETAEVRLKANAEQMFNDWTFNQAGALKHNPWNRKHVKFAILGDEIREVVGARQINENAFFKRMFTEYLQSQGLKLGFFGLRKWDQIVAVDHQPLPKWLKKAREQERLKREVDKATRKRMETGLDVLDEGDDEDEDIEAEFDAAAKAEKEKAEKRLAQADTEHRKKYEKRVYYWTQRFRSFYYCLYYRQWSQAKFRAMPKDCRGSVNLQAMPTMAGRMWSGQCNIFDIGRLNAFDAIMTEDWYSSTLGVAFGYEIIRAAARKNQQVIASLIVGHRPGHRVIAHVAQGSRYLMFYLYGPIHRIGPVWGEHPPTLRDIGTVLRQIRRCEDDILASHNRPADAALLVANTSEINSVQRDLGFARERRGLYQALLNAQLPIEVVGEQEIIEDNALARYRVLYAGDSHVRREVQIKIKEWVKNGGVLWASKHALAYTEYDEPSPILNDAFGLKSSRTVAAIPRAAAKGPSELVILAGGEEKISGRVSAPDPRWVVSPAATVPGNFANGSPAVVCNRYGAGTLVKTFPESGRRRLVEYGTKFGKVRRHLQAGNRPGLYCWLHDGPAQTVVFIVNETGKAIEALELQVSLPWQPARAYLGSGRPVKLTAAPTGAVAKFLLPASGTDILVFRRRN